MARLKPDQSLRKNLRRIARRRLEKAVAAADRTSEGERDESVHEVRTSCKKLRALLRLVRPKIGDEVYRRENDDFRDIARPLTHVRDAKVLVDTLDKVLEDFAGDHGSFDELRQSLLRDFETVQAKILDQERALEQSREALREGDADIEEWTDVPNRCAGVSDGIVKTWKQASDAFAEAKEDVQCIEKWHEWRKQVKYLRYQLETVAPLWPERVEELAAEAKQMGTLLGDDHDLSVLRQRIEQDESKAEGDFAPLLAAIEKRQNELRKESLLLGERFFTEGPKELRRHLKSYWKIWRSPRTFAQVG